jgi:hypothetical protein
LLGKNFRFVNKSGILLGFGKNPICALNKFALFSLIPFMKNYLCQKCRLLIVSNEAPSSLHCPSGRFHKWTYLGQVGDLAFHCTKCKTLVKSRLVPVILNCPEGGFHTWEKI